MDLIFEEAVAAAVCLVWGAYVLVTVPFRIVGCAVRAIVAKVRG